MRRVWLIALAPVVVGCASTVTSPIVPPAGARCPLPVLSPPPAPVKTIGSGSPGGCTEAALRAALASAGTVRFDCGPAPVTIVLSSELSVAASPVEVDGGGRVTLSGGGRTRVLSTGTGVDLTLRGLAIADGARGGAGSSVADGAGIRSGYRARLTVVNGRFQRNVSTATDDFPGGGAIATASEGSLVVVGSSFEGNRAPNGGAIKSLLSDVWIVDSNFVNNEATTGPAESGRGGAIYIDGSAAAELCGLGVRANRASHQGGGLFVFLYPTESAILRRSAVEANEAAGLGHGGGVWNQGGSLLITQSTLAGNRAWGQGGGLWSGEGATTRLTSSTVAGNRAAGSSPATGLGGGIAAWRATVELESSTVAWNGAGAGGGAVFAASSTARARSTVVAENGVEGCAWPLTDLGYNVLQAGCGATTTLEARLLPLADNGGPTRTVALADGSPAIDAGDPAACPPTDQRGEPRHRACDAGAFEAP